MKVLVRSFAENDVQRETPSRCGDREALMAFVEPDRKEIKAFGQKNAFSLEKRLERVCNTWRGNSKVTALREKES